MTHVQLDATVISILWAAVFLGWLSAFSWGPIRHLVIAVQGNVAIVNYRYTGIEEQHRKWETWVALPLLAYILSMVSGISTSLLLSAQYIWAELLLLIGILAIAYGGIFGMQGTPRDEDFKNSVTPGTFLAELKIREEDQGYLDAKDLALAKEGISNLKYEQEPPWRRRVREQLCQAYSLDLKNGPRYGALRWRDADGRTIRIGLINLTRTWRHSPSLIVSVMMAFIHSMLLIFTAATAGLRQDTWVHISFVAAIVLFPVATLLSAILGARASLIYKVRLYIAERGYALEICEALGRAEKKQQDVQSPTPVTERVAVVCERLAIALRRI